MSRVYRVQSSELRVFEFLTIQRSERGGRNSREHSREGCAAAFVTGLCKLSLKAWSVGEGGAISVFFMQALLPILCQDA